MQQVGRQIGAARRASIGALGRSWIFWPSVLFFGVLAKGPEPWGSTWSWLGFLILVGPVLAFAIRTITPRVRARATPVGLDRLLRHLRGTNSPS